MTTYYVDTSALAKRYINEVGSVWVLSWVLPPAGNVIVVSELVFAEMFSLLARRQREGYVSLFSRNTLQGNFLLDMHREYLRVPIDDDVLTESRQLVNDYPLRALDSIQLASAINAFRLLQVPITFVSADKNLLSAASAEGFGVDDPNVHP